MRYLCWNSTASKWYLVYLPQKSKNISSYDDVFDHSLTGTLAYTSQLYSEAMDIRPAVSYIPYTTSSREKTGDIITFAQNKEGNLLSESCNDTESGDKYDDDSTIAPLIIEAEMDAVLSGYASDAEPMSTDILEDILDRSQSNLSINRRDMRYNIRDCFKQRRA